MIKNKLSKTIKKLSVLFLCLSLISASTFFAGAAGSLQLNPEGTDGYRFYSEWHSKTTAGIARQQVISVYLFAGEAAYFASSVYNSKIDQDDNVTDSETGADVLVTSPLGETVAYDVKQNGTGHLSNRDMELYGPKYYYSDDQQTQTSVLDEKGYKPLSFVANYTGVYQFKFHSISNTETANTYGNTKIDASPKQGNGHVARWDITVVDKNNKEDIIRHGRTFTNYLALSTGGNNIYSNMSIYVLTSDGFIYNVKLNDVSPYGFILFANNKGLVSANIDGTQIYHSIGSMDNDLTGLKENNKVQFHSPSAVDNDMNKTYKIFFEEPNKDLEGILYSKATAPSTVSNIKFYGHSENTSYHKHGGYFTFNVSNASSATLKLDFSKSIPEDSGYTGSGIVEVSDAVVEGENHFYWDGKDTTGQYIPIGTYNSEKIEMTISPKAGEIHFPLFDVEAMGSMEISRVNDVYDENGKLISSKDAPDAKNIYFNNNPLAKGTITGEGSPITSSEFSNYYSLADGTNSIGQLYTGFSEKILSSLVKDTLTGNYSHTGLDSSQKNCVSFSYVIGAEYFGGNQSVVDTWTYYKTADQTLSEEITNITITPEPKEGAVTLRGRVFYDEDANGKFQDVLTSKDYTLRNMPITLQDKETGKIFSENTDENGNFHFYNLPYGEYILTSELNTFLEHTYVCTTNNRTQTITLSKDTVPDTNIYDAPLIGYYIPEKADKDLYIKKEWAEGTVPLKSIYVEAWVEYDDADGNQVTMFTGKAKTLNSGNGWLTQLMDMPEYYTDDFGVPHKLNHFVKEYYYEGDKKILIGESDYSASFVENVQSRESTSNPESKYIVNFTYKKYDASHNMILLTNAAKEDYMVFFHDNTHVNDTNIFRIYVPNTAQGAPEYRLTEENQINHFYDIPTAEGKIFKGWYYDKDNSDDSRPIKWDTDTYLETTHIYAHWIDVGSVNKDSKDEKLTGSHNYKGFDMFGAQIRRALYDPNYPGGSGVYPDEEDNIVTETGLRFVTTIKESILQDLNTLYDTGKEYGTFRSQDLNYGYITAKKATADKHVNNISGYTLQYKDKNVNGVDTTTDYKYVTNVECTSSVGNYTSNGTSILDHRNFDTYRIYSMVITYDNPDPSLTEAAQKTNVIARPYIRYSDANGLYRTYYNTYTGTNTYGGCSTNYSYILSQISGLEDVK